MGGGAHEYLLGFCGSSLAGLVEGSLVRRMEGGAGEAAAFPAAVLESFFGELELFVWELELFARGAGRLLSTCEGDKTQGSGKGTTRAEDAQGTLTQSRISPSILVYAG